LAVVLAAWLFAGCSQDSSSTGSGSASSSVSPSAGSPGSAAGANRPPVIRSARLLANALTRHDTVTAEFTTDDPDGDRVAVRYQWLVNGVPEEGRRGAALPLGELRRGDRVSVELTPVDARGAVGQPFRTEPVEVGNTPPTVTRVAIEPAVARPGDVLHAVVEGSDLDGDPVTYRFEWWRNGQSLGPPPKDHERRTLATDGFVRGDLIVLGVTPYDAAGPGRFLVSEPLVLQNRPPVITSSPSGPSRPGSFEYAVTATDPDGDHLTYKLDTAPPGMTIDPATGTITWQATSGLSAPQQVRVSVDDGHQGQAFQEFTIMPPPAR
jgi:hypothetical protein